MGLGKFVAGRMYRMRATKSSLAAHPSWFDEELELICPVAGLNQKPSSTLSFTAQPAHEPGTSYWKRLTASMRTVQYGPNPPS